MNAAFRRTPQVDADELSDLAELLPAPGSPVLSVDRHRHLKEHVMNHIEWESTAATAGRKPRLRRLAWRLVPATAAVVAVAVGLGVTGYAPWVDEEPTAHASAGSDRSGVIPQTPATELLGRVALVAESKTTSAVRDDQFVYVDSQVAWMESVVDGPTTMPAVHRRQVWLSVDGTRTGLVIEDQPNFEDGEHLFEPQPKNSIGTYRYLESLPTDPHVLLKKIYHDTKGMGPGPDEEAFVAIGDFIMESAMPPKLNGAFFRAAALIPGVVLVDDAVDAAGRRGIAVAYGNSDGRTEWIFDAKTLEFLGERSVLLRDQGGLKAGTVTGTTAIITRAIVDKVRQTPPPTRG